MTIIINKQEDLEAFINGLSYGKTLKAGEVAVNNAYAFTSILVEALEHYEDYIKNKGEYEGIPYTSDDVKKVRMICWNIFEKARDRSAE